MHTDEYEISLSREVGVCSGLMRKYQRLLAVMEARHSMTTADFMDQSRLGGLPATADFTAWRDGVDALRHWSSTRDEYERLLSIMKISAP
jgi:hypothetical protein